MPNRENYSGFKYFQEIVPQIVDADVNGSDVDTQGFDSLTFVVNIGKLSSINSVSYWVLRMQHTEASALGAGPSDYANVDASHVITDFSGALTSGIVMSIWSDQFSGTIGLAGYRGPQRYARLVLEEKGNLSTAEIDAIAVLGCPTQWPVNTPG